MPLKKDAATGRCRCVRIWTWEFAILKQSPSQHSWRAFLISMLNPSTPRCNLSHLTIINYYKASKVQTRYQTESSDLEGTHTICDCIRPVHWVPLATDRIVRLNLIVDWGPQGGQPCLLSVWDVWTAVGNKVKTDLRSFEAEVVDDVVEDARLGQVRLHLPWQVHGGIRHACDHRLGRRVGEGGGFRHLVERPILCGHRNTNAYD